MSEALQKAAVELLWRQWTAVGVMGVAPIPAHGIDLEALIAFTPFVAAADPRLADEATDWCFRIGKHFISKSRLRNVAALMPPSAEREQGSLVDMLLGEAEAIAAPSGKSKPPDLSRPALLQLRSRYVFGVGARADIMANLAMLGRAPGPQRASQLAPVGYTKQIVGLVLDELAQAAVLLKHVATSRVAYELNRETAVRALLSPLPVSMPPWVHRFRIVATILETWRAIGSRRTYVVELAKKLREMNDVLAPIGERVPMSAEPARLLEAIDRWAISLLDDATWDAAWIVGDKDVSGEILDRLSDDLIRAVHEGDYPVGSVELDTPVFRRHGSSSGVADLEVAFTAPHHREDFTFNGHVEATFTYDVDCEEPDEFVESIEIERADAHFDMGEPETA